MKNGQAPASSLTNGDEIAADLVLSSVDPNLTFLKFIDPKELPDEFLRRGAAITEYRGSSGKVNLALDALPNFTCLPGDGPHLRGALSDLAARRLHGARLRSGASTASSRGGRTSTW